MLTRGISMMCHVATIDWRDKIIVYKCTFYISNKNALKLVVMRRVGFFTFDLTPK